MYNSDKESERIAKQRDEQRKQQDDYHKRQAAEFQRRTEQEIRDRTSSAAFHGVPYAGYDSRISSSENEKNKSQYNSTKYWLHDDSKSNSNIIGETSTNSPPPISAPVSNQIIENNWNYGHVSKPNNDSFEVITKAIAIIIILLLFLFMFSLA